jgi:hypothetical protein
MVSRWVQEAVASLTSPQAAKSDRYPERNVP